MSNAFAIYIINDIIILGSDKIKNYNVIISLKKKLDKLVLNKKLTSRCVVNLSKKIDKLQNKLYYNI